MKKKLFTVPAFAALAIVLLSGCTGNPPVHTYWLKNPTTGTYTEHRTYSRLSADEARELGLVSTLPENAKIIE